MHARLTSVRTIGEATLIRDALALEGITVEIRGEHRSALAGQLPLGEAEVELWVGASDEVRARTLLARPSNTTANVPCEKCGELSPQNFELCWKCQEPMTGRANPVRAEPTTRGPSRFLLVTGAIFGLICAAIGYGAGTRNPYQYDDRALFSRWSLDKSCREEIRRGTGEKLSESCVDGAGMLSVHRQFAPGGWLAAENFYASTDLPIRVRSYSALGAVTESYDDDANAVFERGVVFGPDHKTIVQEWVDANEDGRVDKLIEHRADGLRVVWRDARDDGSFRKREIYNGDVLLITEQDDGAAGFSKISPR